MSDPKHEKPQAISMDCLCGNIIPKKAAQLSGGPQYSKGHHIHCPKCSRTVAQFVDPKETL